MEQISHFMRPSKKVNRMEFLNQHKDSVSIEKTESLGFEFDYSDVRKQNLISFQGGH